MVSRYISTQYLLSRYISTQYLVSRYISTQFLVHRYIYTVSCCRYRVSSFAPVLHPSTAPHTLLLGE